MESLDKQFCSIHEKNLLLLRGLARKWGIPYDEIEDVVQETFASYFSHYPLTWEDSKVRSMLAKILKNICIDYFRKNDRRPLSYMEPEQMQMITAGAEYLMGKDTLSILIQKEEYRQVVDALHSMKEEWAAVFWLYVIQDRPMKEVSDILGVSEAACRTRLMRGRKYLKDTLNAKQETKSDSKGAKVNNQKIRHKKMERQGILELKKPPETSIGAEVPGSA